LAESKTVKRYVAIICKDADSAFGVHFPDLPGCIAAGNTLEDAIDNAGVALRLWSEDISEIPSPTAMADLLKQKDVRGDLDTGGLAILVPLLTSGRKQRLNIMIEPTLVEATDFAARTTGVSRSAYIERALQSELGREIGLVEAPSSPARKASKARSNAKTAP
jgi:predicted RNase H-like HicB family nuclease